MKNIITNIKSTLTNTIHSIVSSVSKFTMARRNTVMARRNTVMAHRNTVMVYRNIVMAGFCIAISCLLVACNSSDCPLNNTVAQVSCFYDAADNSQLTIEDTLTVAIRDSVILNRMTGAARINLPLSHSGDIDTLLFRFTPKGSDSYVCDTIVVHKTNIPHFVSLDCGMSVFHKLLSVSCSARKPDNTFRYAISSVKIKNNDVTNDEKENLQIFVAVSN